MFLLRNTVELVHGLVDGFDDVRQNGVFRVVHFAIGDTFQGQIKHFILDFLLVVLVCPVDTLEGLLHNSRNNLVLVDTLNRFGFFEDVLRSGVQVVFESDLLSDQKLHKKSSYGKKSVVSDGQVVGMDRFVFNLFFGSAHQVADTSFCVLSPISLDVGEFHIEDAAVEAVQERHEEVLFALEPEVVVGEVESPGPSARLSEHEEVFSTGDEA